MEFITLQYANCYKDDSGEFFLAFCQIRQRAINSNCIKEDLSRTSEKTNTGLMNTFKKVDGIKAGSENTKRHL